MNIEFWKQLKEYFETEYDGIVAREEGIKFAKELLPMQTTTKQVKLSNGLVVQFCMQMMIRKI